MHLMKKGAYTTLEPIFNVILGKFKDGKILYLGLLIVGKILRLPSKGGATDNQKSSIPIDISASQSAFVAHLLTDRCIPWWSADCLPIETLVSNP